MEIARAIRDALSIETSDRPPDRISYARDLWPRHQIDVRAGRIAEHRPAAVAWPETTEQVASLLRFCSAEGIAIVPYGAGSGVCGSVLPTAETLVIDVKRMKRWRRFAPHEGYLDVEAGALGIRLEEDLNAKGFTVGHFPSSILCSTVGGWVAARGAGQCSGLYGKVEDMTVALECVDGRGDVATLHRRLRGPDLTPLIVGSEGTLAVITSAKLRLHPLAEARAAAGFACASMQAGHQVIRAIYQAGLRPAVCRLYDPFDSLMARHGEHKRERRRRAGGSKTPPTPWLHRVALRNLLRLPTAVNAAVDALGRRLFGGALLVLLCEGPADRAQAELVEARRIATAAGAKDLGEGPARHWLERRYSISYKQAPMFGMGAFVDTMEVAAPWSKLGQVYDAVRVALGQHVMVMAHMSHAYPDGCSIYFTFAGSAANDEAALRRYDAAWRDAMQAVIEAGGTLSHHHGIGRSKAPRMGSEIGLGVELLGALQRALDPDAILNPGNLMPARMPPRQPLAAAPTAPAIDELSRTVHVSGSHKLAEVGAALETCGLSLGIDESVDGSINVCDWLADGAPGAADPWLDPVDHLVSGFSVELPSGAALDIRPCPRRAVGPDLWALFFGTAGRAGRIHSVHLRARGATAQPLETNLERNPPIDATERGWIDRVVEATAALR